MQTKLTLRMDDDLIRRAKAYAEQTGRSVSQIVADYFSLLGTADHEDEVSLPPTVDSLQGVLSGHDLEEEDYRRYLERKHL